MRTPREISESYWAAECRRDIDAVLAHYHPDAAYQDGAGHYAGLASIRGFYESSAQAYPGLELKIVGEVSSGHAGALEFEAQLTDPDGRRSIIRGVNVVTVRDGRFISVRSYEDSPRSLGEAG